MKKKLELKTTQKFIEESSSIHKNTYSYSLVEYANCKKKVVILCKEHGSFEQSPDAHINQKQGCPRCKNKKLLSTTEEFVCKAKQVHGSRYDYSLVDYVNSTTKVKIICKKHSIFEQRPSKHIGNNRGCPKCGIDRIKEFQAENYIGWNNTEWERAGMISNNFDSFKVYIIRCWNNNEDFYKVGKTFNSLKRRFDCEGSMPYNYEVISTIKGTAKEVSKLEKRLQKENKKHKYLPKIKFNGMQECFHNILKI